MWTRRRLWLVGLALVAVVFSGCNFDWTMVGYNAADTFSTPDTSLNATDVPDLVQAFSGNTGGEVLGSPIVAKGVLYVVSYVSSSQAVSLDAFDAAGKTDCSGGTCQPLWTAALGTASTAPSSSPAVVNGVVHAGSSNNLEAFDAAGVTNCSGTPTTCVPLWSASVGPVGNSSPIVANGVVYIGSTDDNLYTFDAAGVTNCSGTPTTCAPLWSANTGGPIQSAPAVANGVAYVGSTDDDFYAFDAAGVTNCSGTPTTCSPLWSATTPGPIEVSPAVANGIVYVGTDQGNAYTDNNLEAFDANGVTNCSGTPTTCTPLWTYEVETEAIGAPAVADGYVYESEALHIEGGALEAFDASGNTDCSGTPKVCAPVWTSNGYPVGQSVANGLVYVSGAVGPTPGSITEYDETGQFVASVQPVDAEGPPVVANGMVYVGGGGVSAYAPLRTQVLIPSNGSSVSGTTVLDAIGAPGVTLSGVQFVVSGISVSDQVVGTATPTLYGWIAEWDTTTVPDGTYTLQSEATTPTLGSPVMSPGINITVNNSSS